MRGKRVAPCTAVERAGGLLVWLVRRRGVAREAVGVAAEEACGVVAVGWVRAGCSVVRWGTGWGWIVHADAGYPCFS